MNHSDDDDSNHDGDDSVPSVTATGQDDEGTKKDNDDVVGTEDRMLVDIVDKSSLYGRGHRGMVAKQPFGPGDLIQQEVAAAYVSHALNPETSSRDMDIFFLGGDKRPYDICPPELTNVRGGLYIALTGILIWDREPLCLRVIEEGPWALFGRIHTGRFLDPYEAYKHIKQLYLDPLAEEQPEKAARWTQREVGRLYSVVQLNALAGHIPVSAHVYGAGFFPCAAFFNHSCNPNAIATMLPNKLVIQALTSIDQWEEITIAYQELPVDLLNTSLVRAHHHASGVITMAAFGEDADQGCRCNMCTMVNEAEGKIIAEAGGDPTKDERIVELDMERMWLYETQQRLAMDEQFKSFVISMFYHPGEELGAAASFALRERYGHFLSPGGKDYCADLAFVLGELYCTQTIHIPKQTADNYMWWPRVYAEAIGQSDITLPHSITNAMMARCYGAILACQERAQDDAATQTEDMNVFLINWIGLRQLHRATFGHVAYLTLVCKAYPIIGDLVARMKDEVTRVEAELMAKEALRQEERQAEAMRAQQETSDADALLQADKEPVEEKRDAGEGEKSL